MITESDIEIIRWEIGKEYHYPNDNKIFKLKKVSDGIQPNFYFECGHWCTFNVFIDLLPVKKQLKLF